MNFNFEGIIKISLADTTRVVGKEYIKLVKEDNTKDKKILIFKKRREEYGRASD
jgi:hypothetical protein